MSTHPQDINWSMNRTVLTGSYRNPVPSLKVAAFDFDDTLVNKSFADPEMSSYTFQSVPTILRALNEAGYLVCIVSNQGDIGRATKTREETTRRVQRRFDTFLQSVGIPCLVLASTRDDEFKKPSVGMWAMVLEFCPAVTDSFYVGNAAGRAGDHSDSDREFAKNTGLSFFTETQFFRERGYTKYTDVEDFPTARRVSSFTFSDKQEVVVMVGCQGSGKSTYTEQMEAAGYKVIHGDDYKSDKKRMLREALNGVSAGYSVVIDATNPSVEARAFYLSAFRDTGLPVRAVHISTDFDTCMQRNNQRERPVAKIALYTYRKNAVPPTVEEGFSEVVTV